MDPTGPVETYLSDETKVRKVKWRDLKGEHMRDDYEKSSRFVSKPISLNAFFSKPTIMLKRKLSET